MHIPRCVYALSLAALCAVSAYSQQSSSRMVAFNDAADASSSPIGVMRPPAASVTEPWFLRRFGMGTYSSPLGFGGRLAVSLSRSLVLRGGGSYFNFSLSSTQDDIPYTAHVVLQSEQVGVDWYPFHGNFHVTPGVLFGSSNRLYGSALITPGQSFTLNGTNYYSSAVNPVNGYGRIDFNHTAPTLTMGWGSWVRREARNRHWTFPFEFGVAFMGDPKTELSFTGTVCQDAALHNCQNIADDAEAQANVTAEHRKMQNDANYARFYPIIAGGIVYRF